MYLTSPLPMDIGLLDEFYREKNDTKAVYIKSLQKLEFYALYKKQKMEHAT